MSVKLTITPLKISDQEPIPSTEDIIASARVIQASTTSWKLGKKYGKGTVQTMWAPKGPDDGAPWHARLSEHGKEDATFDQFWSKLGQDKALHEKAFIPEINKAVKVKELNSTQIIWTLYYKFPPPVSPRVFTELQTIFLEGEPGSRTGWAISQPVDLSGDPELAKLEEKGVKGRYVSIESLKELPSGKVEWRMCTSSSAGGSIPSWVAESTMPGQISEDVTRFLKWLHTLPATVPVHEEEAQHQKDLETGAVAPGATLAASGGAANTDVELIPEGTAGPVI